MQIRLFVSRHDSVLKTLIWQSFNGVKVCKTSKWQNLYIMESETFLYVFGCNPAEAEP